MLQSSVKRTIFYCVLKSMDKLFITPKRKSCHRSDSELSTERKSNSAAKILSDEDEVMEVL